MKKYFSPDFEIVKVNCDDVITASPGTETPWYEEADGSWEITVGG